MRQLGGKVEGGHAAEFGRAEVEISAKIALFDGVWRQGGTLSGVDEPRRPRHRLPAGIPRHRPRRDAPFAVIADETRRYLRRRMFHPEVAHTPDGAQADRQLRAQDRRHQGRLDDGRLPRRGDRARSAPRSDERGSSAASRAASTRRSRRC